jgi:hypothetical protein
MDWMDELADRRRRIAARGVDAKPEDPMTMAKPKPTIKTKRQRFLDHAERRTEAALEALRRLRNCANRAGYEYRDHEAEEICNAIAAAFDGLRTAFLEPPQPKTRRAPFRLRVEPEEPEPE